MTTTPARTTPDQGAPDPAGPVRSETAVDGPPAPRTARFMPFLERYALLLLLVLLCVFFSAYGPTSETFPSPANLRNILGNEAVIAVTALASIIPLTCGQFDLSVGSVVGLSSIITASMAAEHDLPVAVAILLGVLSGCVVGLVNGVLVAKIGVNALIATLGTSTLVAGLISLYTANQVISIGIPESITALGSGTWLGLPRTVFSLAVVALAVYYLLTHTPYGRYLASVGVSPGSARLVGLRVDRYVLSSFVLSGALAGVAGVLLLARAGTANPQVGPGFTLAALSAAFLGATAIKPGRFNVLGTLLGVLFVAVSVNGLVLAGAADWVQPTFNGAALLVAVALSTAIARRRAGT
ncbi:monosaccharide ABC transporter membrane protein (CUT2 family) [Blastococcus colisei]|uniref:Monosaccharide ABC transporter membrane protein (CUT2 family) n=1 Tax=Blastococcus colisei TaxID=1564162 RepID=A0A543PAM0_9ACTN|nr:ABC transporter permease [Blastococcus colisei]TQN41122.1 monosaccharide ABC transporter membrane protein (CUT2 family) [Blastococcus colisei]